MRSRKWTAADLPDLTDRVVTVASSAHRMGRIDLDDLNWERRSYDAWRAYGQSKLATSSSRSSSSAG